MNLLMMALLTFATPTSQPHFTATVTIYQPWQKDNKPHYDRFAGGGNASFTGQKLMNYHCATSKKYNGTIFYLGKPFNKRYISVDTGSAVHGNHIDVCIIDGKTFLKMNGKYKVKVWKLAKLNRKQARAWKP
jgi:hypothetical protein